jgi:hypothetical protein
MSLFESASLVVTPNGTKASKLYAIKPTSGAGDLTVTRATTARRVNSAGLIESVAVNVPRLDYLNSTCPSVLVEPQRTNVQTYSEDFSNAIYIKIGATVTTNSIVAPDGTTTADKLVEDNSTGIHVIDIINPPVTLADYTISVFVKAAERNKFQISEVFTVGGNVTFDLTAGTATSTAPAKNGKIENYGNGWYKCSATWPNLTGASTQILFTLLNASGASSYTGTSGSGLYLWGAQLEAGAYATSYIPTVASSVTRNADVISKTGISSLIGQTEGTLFYDLVFPQNQDASYIGVSNGTTVNRIILGVEGGTFYSFGYGTAVLSLNINTRYKIALSYNSTNMLIYVNGVLTNTVTGSVPSGLNRFGLDSGGGNQNLISNINTLALWKTRLTNAELAELTTI